MSVKVLNPNAEVLNKSAALHMNINAAKGLQDVLKTNLGPKGTIKMSVAHTLFFLALISSSYLLEALIFCLTTGLLAVRVTLSSLRMVTHC